MIEKITSLLACGTDQTPFDVYCSGQLSVKQDSDLMPWV